MKLSVLRANKVLTEIDLASEVAGIPGPHSFYIGRSDECHVHLDDKQVSREHAEIVFDANAWTIYRLSDSSTVILNGNPCAEAKLKNGDVISIGPFLLNVSIAEPVKIPEPVAEIKVAEYIPSNEENETQATKAMEPPTASSTETTALPEEPTSPTQEIPLVSSDDQVGENNYDESIGNTAAPVGEVSSAEVAMDFNETPLDNPEGENLESLDNLESSSDNSMEVSSESDEGKTQVLRAFAKFELEIVGEFAPYDKFNLELPETFIGRDPSKCQIVLKDPEVSSVHAVIRKNNIICILEDLKSANGTILNAKRINKADLTMGDEFIIGSTTFTFKVQSDLLREEEKRFMPVDEDQEIEVVEEVEETVSFEDGSGGTEGSESALNFGDDPAAKPQSKSLFSKEALKDPAKRKKILIIAVVLIGGWIMLSDDSATKKPGPQTGVKKEKDASNLLPGTEGATASGTDPAKVNPLEVKRVVKKLTKEETEFAEATYLLSKDHYEKGRYREAMFELEKVLSLAGEYKNARQMHDLSKQGLAKQEELERKRREEIEKKERQEKIKVLVEKAKDATKERRSELAESLFGEILKMDPENYDVPQMKLDLEAWKREQDRIAQEKAQKEADRAKKVSQLAPAKNFYLKKEWYKAQVKLEEFLKITPMDEDLTKEGSDMLADSRKQLQDIVNPLLGKARSMKEGQDLKGAYEAYLQIIAFDPMSSEALNEMAEIRDTLYSRARKIYREGIISESLSLFEDAKEKFQEVQQISPSDSEYYKKASEKLKDYTD